MTSEKPFDRAGEESVQDILSDIADLLGQLSTPLDDAQLAARLNAVASLEPDHSHTQQLAYMPPVPPLSIEQHLAKHLPAETRSTATIELREHVNFHPSSARIDLAALDAEVNPVELLEAPEADTRLGLEEADTHKRASLTHPAQIQAQRRTIRELIQTCLVELGYHLETELDIDDTTISRFSRHGWRGEHSADVWIDTAGVLHGRVLQEHQANGDYAMMTERQRCEDFNRDIMALSIRLGRPVDVDPSYRPVQRFGPEPSTDLNTEPHLARLREKE